MLSIWSRPFFFFFLFFLFFCFFLFLFVCCCLFGKELKENADYPHFLLFTQNLRTEGRWFDLRLEHFFLTEKTQDSFLSLRLLVPKMIMKEISQWFEKKILCEARLKELKRKAWIGAPSTAI